MAQEMKILTAGDSAVTVQFGDRIDPAIYVHVKGLQQALEKARPEGIVELIPTFRSLMVQYNPLVLPYDKLHALLEELAGHAEGTLQEKKKIVELPVCFEEKYAPDLAHVMEHTHLTAEQVKELTCSRDVLIYMIGFTPGYPYLGGMDPKLTTPRLASPRLQVPAGAVGIGGDQLGVYSVESPGGFQLIGQTPVHLYDPTRKDSVLLRAGEYIRFVPISSGEYDRIADEEAAGTYKVRMWEE